jgi:DNA-binding beta-propeller fold protein YncE
VIALAASVLVASVLIAPAGLLGLRPAHAGAMPAIVPEPWKVVSAAGGVAPLYPAAIAFAPNGTRYVADSGRDRIVTVSNGGKMRVVSAAAEGWRDPKDLSVDARRARFLWATNTNPTTRADEVVKVDTSTGAIVARHVAAGIDGFTDPQGVANDASGVYVADTYGGRIVKMTRAGGILWQLDACAGSSFGRPRDVSIGSNGAVYVADTDNDRVVRLTPEGGCVGAFGTPGSAEGQLNAPRAIASDGNGGLWITEGLNVRVQHFSNAGAPTSGSAYGTYGGGRRGFRSPFCVAVSGARVEVCDTFGFRIQRLRVTDAGGLRWLDTLGGKKPANGGFNGPWDVAYAPDGTFVVSDWFNHRLQRFAADGTYLSKIGAYGLPERQFIFPRGLGSDGGTLVVTDSENNRLQFLDPATWSSVADVVRPDGVPKFSRPHQTAAVGDGTYWVADTLNGRALHLDGDGTELHEIDVAGTPRGVAVDSVGRVYVAHGDRIDRFSATGVFDVQIASAGTAAGNVKQPYGLRVAELDGTELLFVADRENDRVQILELDGTLVDVLDPSGTSIGSFDKPQGVDVNPVTGAIAVADFGNDRVVLWTT